MCLTCGSELMRSGGEGRSGNEFKTTHVGAEKWESMKGERIGWVAKSSERNIVWKV